MRKSQAAILGLTLSFCLLAQQPVPKAISRAQEGLALAKQGKYKEAVVAYQQALAADPKLPGLHLNLGLALFKLGDFRKAIPEFQSELKSGPNQQASTLLAISFYGAGDFRTAAEHLKVVSAAYPDNKEVPYLLAQAYIQSSQYAEAAECFRKLLELDPDSVQVHILLAEALDGIYRTEEATAEFETAVRMAPKEPNVHFGLGYLLWKQKRYEDADREFHAELSNDPRNPLAMAYLADSLLKRSQDAPAAIKLQLALYETRGRVEALAGDQITFSHEPVPALGWPAMTMSFKLDPPTLAKGVKVGDRMAFGFEQRPEGPVIRRLSPVSAQ